MFTSNILQKANNTNSIRVLYKKVNCLPDVKIISDISNLKKIIVIKKLEIIPLKNLYIICNNQKQHSYLKPNILINLNSIFGDIILTHINKNEREFKSLSQEEIFIFSKYLIDISFNTSNNDYPSNYNSFNRKKSSFSFERDFGYTKDYKNTNFEKDLINVLVNIELVLANLLRNKNNGDCENE